MAILRKTIKNPSAKFKKPSAKFKKPSAKFKKPSEKLKFVNFITCTKNFFASMLLYTYFMGKLPLNIWLNRCAFVFG